MNKGKPPVEKDNQPNYTWKLSKTFDIKNIKGIIFGGLSSRFWSFRKQLNLIDMSHNLDSINKQIPFLSWECLTIQG